MTKREATEYAVLRDAKRSMLGLFLPREYGRIETTGEAAAEALREPSQVLRIVIVWDNEVKSLDLESALDHLRATGAAFVLSVEEVSK